VSKTPREVLALAGMLGDQGWQVFSTRVRERIDTFTRELKDPSEARRAKLSDDHLRGEITALEWALSWPTSVVSTTLENDAETRDQEREEKLNDLRVRLGSTFPFAA